MGLEEELKSRMEGYRYGRYNLLENDFDIVDFGVGVCIKNFYGKNFTKEGDCKDLSETFYSENLDLNLVKVVGQEPRFFSKEKAIHYYLLGFDNFVPDSFWNFDLKDKSSIVKDLNPLVIDPSFNYVSRFLGSKYTAFDFLKDSFKKEEDLILSLISNNNIPLGLINENELAIISYLNNELGIIIQMKNSLDGDYYFLDNQDLFSKLSFNKDLCKIVENISKKYGKLEPKNYYFLEINKPKKVMPSLDEIFCEYQNYN